MRESKTIVSLVHYSDRILKIIFNEIKQTDHDYLTFKDMLWALSAYKIDMNSGRQVTKEDYISMSKYMFMQICQQAEMTIHLSQYKDNKTPRSPMKSVRGDKSPLKSARSNHKKANSINVGNPMFETAYQRK